MDFKKDILSKCSLFNHIAIEDYPHILKCFEASYQIYNNEEYIIFTGDVVNHIYIIIDGEVALMKENFAGNCHIVTILTSSNLFGEGIICTTNRIAPVTVKTKTKCTVLKIPYKKMLVPCSNSCSFHNQLIFNMMMLLGNKNYSLNQKIDLLLIKSMREKLATYLLQQEAIHHASTFYIQLNRNELADFLNVSRPSMSRELARMKADKLIDFQKNCFTILNREKLLNCLENE